jgi:signal transduction histidine kinase
VDLTAFRIIQEALTNVTKHAAARGADVRFAWGRERVSITVVDDGIGSPARLARPLGYGLIGMRERAVAAGGSLTASTRPEGGFLVTAHLPLPSADATARGEDRSDSEDR